MNLNKILEAIGQVLEEKDARISALEKELARHKEMVLFLEQELKLRHGQIGVNPAATGATISNVWKEV